MINRPTCSAGNDMGKMKRFVEIDAVTKASRRGIGNRPDRHGRT
jgi:hypothetical protein